MATLRICVLVTMLSAPISLNAHDAKYGYADSWEFCSTADLMDTYPSPERARWLNKNNALKLSIDQFVEEWSGHFEVLHRRVPHISPSESDWVENERSNGRYVAIMETVEHAKFEVEGWIHINLQLLDSISNSSGDERKYHLIHFGYRVENIPADEFNILRKNNLISGFTKWDDEKGRLKSYDENYIPRHDYNMQNTVARWWHQNVERGIAKCFLAIDGVL